MRPNPLKTADLVTFTTEIHNRKLFLCSDAFDFFYSFYHFVLLVHGTWEAIIKIRN